MAYRMPHHNGPFRTRQRAFTLVELVVALTLSTIVAGFVAVFIAAPFQIYGAQSRRADLADSAHAAMRNMDADLRRALPNSVRVTRAGSVVVLELIPVVDGVRYIQSGDTGDALQELDFAGPDAQFATLGKLAGIARPFSSTTHYLVVNNAGIPGVDAYELTNVITPPGMSINIVDDATPGEDLVTLGSPHQFSGSSPTRSIYLVSGPIAYVCDEVAQSLRRFEGYPIVSDIAARDAALSGAGVSSSLIARNVTACQFDYPPAGAGIARIASLRLTLSQAGESIQLFHQVAGQWRQ